MKNQMKNEEKGGGRGLTRQRSVGGLVAFACRKSEEASIEEQILLYQALGDALPTGRQRAMANEVARALSATAALQLTLKKELASQRGGGQE
jgi:hypothetical protein